jgi:hypothetical protein
MAGLTLGSPKGLHSVARRACPGEKRWARRQLHGVGRMKPGLWEYVVERDAYEAWTHSSSSDDYGTWRRRHRVVCMVPFLEPTNRYPCGGKQTVDHVHGQPPVGTLAKTREGGFGKRAPDDPLHLVAACENHNVWHPPSAALRRAERTYLSHCAQAQDQAASH